MISKQDVLLLLTELQDKGLDCTEYINTLYSKDANILGTLKFINDNKNLDLVNFYEKIRKSYNHGSSKLYRNIVQCDEKAEKDPSTILTTLSAMLTQILLYDVEDKAMFYKHARADEINKVLDIYFNTFNIEPAQKLLTLIKSDLIVSEYVNNRRTF